MSDRFFSEPITRCKMRRTWGGTVLAVVMLLLLAAVIWMLVTGCWGLDAGGWMLDGGCWMLDGGSIQSLGSSNQPLVAMAPVTKGAVLGLGVFWILVLVFLAVRKVRENDRFCAELRERTLKAKREKLRQRREFWEQAQWPHDVPVFSRDQDGPAPWTVGPLESLSEPVCGPDPAASECRAPGEDIFAPLRAPGERLRDDEMERILVACAAEGRCIMKHVRRAQMTLSVENYGDELRLAERKLDGVIRCVEALIERLSVGGQVMCPRPFSAEATKAKEGGES